MVKKFINSKQKILRLWQLYYVYKKTGLNGYVYDFSIDYYAVPTVVITHILMIKNIVKNEKV